MIHYTNENESCELWIPVITSPIITQTVPRTPYISHHTRVGFKLTKIVTTDHMHDSPTKHISSFFSPPWSKVTYDSVTKTYYGTSLCHINS